MTFHTPARSTRRRFYRLVDWKAVAAFTAVLLVGVLVWGMISDAQLRGREAEQQEALIEALQQRADEREVLLSEITSLRERITELQKESGRERARLLRQQARMIGLLKRFGVVSSESTAKDIVIVETGRDRNGRRSSPAGGGGSPKTAPSEGVNDPKPPKPVTPSPVPPQAPQPPPQGDPLEDILRAPCALLGC